MKVKVIQISIQVLFGILGLFTLFGILIYSWTLFTYSKKATCPIPPSFFDEPKTITRTIYKVEKKIVRIPVAVQKKQIKPKTINSKKLSNAPQIDNSNCNEALVACKRDRHCHAKGCEELKFYWKGLNSARF